MEKLGIIGGTGPESTLAYYRQLNYGYQKRLSKKVYNCLCWIQYKATFSIY
ncbi:MAG: hypothetical protein ABF908_00700 [Lentilactobacillus diolivorans]